MPPRQGTSRRDQVMTNSPQEELDLRRDINMPKGSPPSRNSLQERAANNDKILESQPIRAFDCELAEFVKVPAKSIRSGGGRDRQNEVRIIRRKGSSYKLNIPITRGPFESCNPSIRGKKERRPGFKSERTRDPVIMI
ncbi:hypothetical protein ACOSQ2_028842 [Xanthoceras sorbifolium]